MGSLRRLAMVLLLSFVVPCQLAMSEVVVNNNVAVPDLRKLRVRAIFFGQVSRWETGRPIRVYVLPPDHPATKEFAWSVLGVSPYAFEERLESLSSTRDGNVPQQVESESEMLKIVAKTPDSIGYLSSFMVAYNVKNSVRVIAVQ